MKECNKCNAQNPGDANICSMCGFNFNEYDNLCHRLLEGVEKEIEGCLPEAINIYKELIDSGFDEAKCNLALCYIFNSDSISVRNQGLILLKEFAQSSNEEAMNLLGRYYYEGINGFLPIDYRQAHFWFNKSYNHNQNAFAARYLGMLYLDGDGNLSQDPDKAFMLLEEATQNEDDEAPAILGWIYEKGYHVPIDLKKAKMYYAIGAERGSDLAKERLNKQKFWYI